jgi:hypothetical protein
MPLIVLFFASSVFAQISAPNWLEESQRDLHYPKSKWYTGFATDKVNGLPGKKEYEAVETNAKNKLSESIIVSVQGSSTVHIENRQMQSGKNFSETKQMNYDNTITTTSSAVLAKIDVKSYFDKKAGYIYGFAVVKKSDLANFYRSNINSAFAFANREFAIIEQLAEQGKKNLAFGKIQAIEDSLKKASHWGSYLQTVEIDSSYTSQEKELWQKINNAKMSLEHSTAVFLDVLAGGQYFLGQLAAQMQNKNCNCIVSEKEEEADYVVKIKTKFLRCTETDLGDVFCYANADASINNPKYQKPVALSIPEAKGGWVNGNREKAEEETLKKLTDNIAEKIVQAINK